MRTWYLPGQHPFVKRQKLLKLKILILHIAILNFIITQLYVAFVITYLYCREPSGARSPGERYREKNRRIDSREEREEHVRPSREPKDRMEREDRGSEDRRKKMYKGEERPRATNDNSRPRERKSR